MTSGELGGVAVAVLRVGEGDDDVRAELERQGAVATTVRVAVVRDRPDDAVVADVGALDRFAWVGVTSANAARRLGLWSASWPSSTRVAAVGRATATAVEAVGLTVGAVANGGTAADLAQCIDAGPVLFLAAANARGDLAGTLAARGIEVTTVVAYDVVPIELDAAARETVRCADALVAMSPSAIDALVALGDDDRDDLHDVPLVAIGPTTQRHASALGWDVGAVAARREPAAVAAALAAALGR